MSYKFGPYVLDNSQVFYESDHCIGIVNIKPIVPGHVLIVSKRNVPRMADLTKEEVQDLYCSVHTATPLLEEKYGACASNIAMQDGRHAGQSVPHVHIHILPRKPGDFKVNDDIYPEIDNQKLDEAFECRGGDAHASVPKGPVDNRVPRSAAVMAAEAAELRLMFPDNPPRFVFK
jgi:bis(5'-adenosyl)-triphosphatase